MIGVLLSKALWALEWILFVFFDRFFPLPLLGTLRVKLSSSTVSNYFWFGKDFWALVKYGLSIQKSVSAEIGTVFACSFKSMSVSFFSNICCSLFLSWDYSLNDILYVFASFLMRDVSFIETFERSKELFCCFFDWCRLIDCFDFAVDRSKMLLFLLEISTSISLISMSFEA